MSTISTIGSIYGTHGFTWFRMVSQISMWFHMVSYWFHMVPDGLYGQWFNGDVFLEVSYRGFHKWWNPQVDGLYWKSMLKLMIWRCSHFREPPNGSMRVLEEQARLAFVLSNSGDLYDGTVLWGKLVINYGIWWI